MTATLPSEIAAFHHTQSWARTIAQNVFDRLEEGVTEREATADLRAEARRQGIKCWLHVPFAWFGDRTGFRDFRSPRDFFPTSRKLYRNDPVILDLAPVVDGFPSDYAHCDVFGEDPEWDRMKQFNDTFKERIVALLSRDRTAAGLYEAVNREIEQAGFHVRHTRYPGKVLGHKLERFVFGDRLNVGEPFTLPFGLMTLGQLKRRDNPLLNARDRQPLQGVWAIEPHMSNGRFGTKFEELLWVHEDGAQWLT